MSNIVLITGLPGTGKSTILKELEKEQNIVLVHEFHTSRKIITKESGAILNGKTFLLENKIIKDIEDKLENNLVRSRFIDNTKEFEKLKLELFKGRLKELQSIQENFIIKEGLFACLIDKCSNEFLQNLKQFIKDKINHIFFLELSDRNELKRRQKSRVEERGGRYDDETNGERNSLFLNQFKFLTEELNKERKITYLNAQDSPKEIIQNLLRSLKC